MELTNTREPERQWLELMQFFISKGVRGRESEKEMDRINAVFYTGRS
jgi:hypothetical protein